MKKTEIMLNQVIIYVSNLDATLFFYRRYGFSVNRRAPTEYGRSAWVILDDCSGLVLEFRELNTMESHTCRVQFEFTPDVLKKGADYETIYLDFKDHGYKFLNVSEGELHGNVISNEMFMRDPDGIISSITNPYL